MHQLPHNICAYLYVCLLTIFYFPFLNTPMYAQSECSVELVLALDVSGSVNGKEFRLQKNGIAKAFQDDEVIELITLLPGGITASITHWSGKNGQRIAIGWKHIQNTADAIEFSEQIEEDRRVRTGALTAIGNALLHADNLLSINPTPCYRSVIDISGDGRSNRGENPTAVADALAAKGVIINALVIVDNDRTLVPYFEKNVIRGDGAFIQTANGYKDYAHAIKQKLLRELLPAIANNTVNPISNTMIANNQPQ